MPSAPKPSDAPSSAPAEREGRSVPKAAAPPGGTRRRRPIVRSFLRALTDPGTFDLRGNPWLAVGFLMGLPVPAVAFAAHGPAWLSILSLLAPATWGLALGAAGRVLEGERAEVARLEVEAAKAQRAAEVEREIRDRLESEQRLMTADLKLAHAIQRTLVPADIVRPEVQVVARLIPSSYVGGDYLHASMPRPDVLYLCIGDVSGHGVAAALVVSRIHGTVRRFVLEQRSPEHFLEELNRRACDILKHTYFFLTFAVFRVDLAARRIDYATAGHPAQALVRSDGTVEPLVTPNRLLGMDADVFDPERPSDSIHYEPGDSLVLFTDGLFEIPGKADGEILGEQGLHDVLRNMGGLPPALIAGDILQDLADFQGDSKFEDDVSLMVARFEPSAVPAAPAAARAAAPAAAPASPGS